MTTETKERPPGYVEPFTGHKDPRFVHVPDIDDARPSEIEAQKKRLVSKVLRAAEQAIRDENPGVDPDKPICVACLLNVFADTTVSAAAKSFMSPTRVNIAVAGAALGVASDQIADAARSAAEFISNTSPALAVLHALGALPDSDKILEMLAEADAENPIKAPAEDDANYPAGMKFFSDI